VAFGMTRQSEEIERLLTIEQVEDSCQVSTKRRCGGDSIASRW
jgi:hypothetical protein